MKVQDGCDVPMEWTSSASDVPIDKSVIDIFEEYASKYPEATAIRWNDEEWTYETLNMQANRIAHLLRSRDYGVKTEDPVAFFFEQSAYPVVAALAIVKAGGTYVPLDPSFQDSHVKYVLEDTGAKVLIHDDSTCDRCTTLASLTTQLLDFDVDQELIAEQPTTNPESTGIRGDSRFHIIYTSGSTGKRKCRISLQSAHVARC